MFAAGLSVIDKHKGAQTSSGRVVLPIPVHPAAATFK